MTGVALRLACLFCQDADHEILMPLNWTHLNIVFLQCIYKQEREIATEWDTQVQFLFGKLQYETWMMLNSWETRRGESGQLSLYCLTHLCMCTYVYCI